MFTGKEINLFFILHNLLKSLIKTFGIEKVAKTVNSTFKEHLINDLEKSKILNATKNKDSKPN